jgi:hypothetical protein
MFDACFVAFQCRGDAKVEAATSSYENVAREELARNTANAEECLFSIELPDSGGRDA